MTEIGFNLSSIILIIAVVFIVVGLIITFMWFFKKNADMTAEDRANMERAKTLWIGATAVGILAIWLMKADKHPRKGAISMTTTTSRSSLL